VNRSSTNLATAPCADWADSLAARHPDDLAPDEQAALQAHLVNCPNCAAVYAAWQAVDAHILRLPAVQPTPQQIARINALVADPAPSTSRRAPVLAPGATAPRRLAPVGRISARLAHSGQQVSSLVAVLLVLALIGSAVALFATRHGGPNMVGAGAPGVLYAVSSTGTAYAVDAASGKTLWSTPLHMKASEQFVVSGDTLYIGSSEYTLYALNARTGQLLWQRSYKDLTMVGAQTVEIAPYPASDGGAIYIGTPKGIYAWRASDGKTQWSYPMPATCGALSGICAPEVATVSNGTVYAWLDGLYALNASDGSLRWKDAEAPDDSPLVVAQHHVYVADYAGKSLRVLDSATGRLLATPHLPNVEPTQLLTDGATVYLSTPAGGATGVYALRASDNTVLWNKQYTQRAISLSGVGDGSLTYLYETASTSAAPHPSAPVTRITSANWQQYLSTVVSHMCAVNASDGSAQWCRQLPNDFTPQLAVARQGTLYITTSGKVEAIRVSDGAVLWTELAHTPLARIELD